MRLLGKFSRQTLIARVSCHLHVFIYITHLTKIPTWKLFRISPMEKSKAEKSPWVKKMKNGPRDKNKSSILSNKEKKPCRKRQRLLVWRNCWRSGAFENPFGAGFVFAFTFGVFAHYYVVVLNWIALSTGVPNSRFEESIKYWWFMYAYRVRRDCLKCAVLRYTVGRWDFERSNKALCGI